MLDWMIRRYVHIVRWFRSEPQLVTPKTRENYRTLMRRVEEDDFDCEERSR